jgi:hypothetical protein
LINGSGISLKENDTMMNNDENKPEKKIIQIFNNKDGTYNRKDFVEGELVNEEFIEHRPQQNYGKSALRDFLENLNNGDLPKGWRESPLGKRAWEVGHQAGYMEGHKEAWVEANLVIDSIRNILKLHDNRVHDEFDD